MAAHGHVHTRRQCHHYYEGTCDLTSCQGGIPLPRQLSWEKNIRKFPAAIITEDPTALNTTVDTHSLGPENPCKLH